MSLRSTRREFLTRTGLAVGAAAGVQALGVPAVLAERSPNSKLGVAVIACGGMGGGNPDAAADQRAVALVDVDENILGRALERIKGRAPGVRTFYDYRKMYDACGKDLDVVLIATPDHHHAPAAMRAIKLGKAVFVQKPMAHDVAECYALMKAAKEKNVMTQMGNQGHYGETIRLVAEYIWNGAIGNVTETHTIFGRNFGGHGKRPPSKPVPKGLHWDEWLGPARFREYHDGLHTFSWRSWKEFGTGTIGDMACHNLDVLFLALKVAEAKKYTIECLAQTPGNDEMYATDNHLLWTVPARGDMPEVKIHAYDHGGLMPKAMKDVQEQYKIKFGECTLFVGQKGLMRSEGTAGGWQFIPYERGKEVPKPPKVLPRAHGGPVGDLFWCLKNGGTPCSDFVTAAGPLASFALSGHLAMAAGVGKKVEWDVEKAECTNLPEVNQFAHREYRPGWEL
ncbi:MAG: Gfo/Idh/MocA family oxidoreductase [Thermoguttaceae bacterium]|jgi:predicted dehydrogenase